MNNDDFNKLAYHFLAVTQANVLRTGLSPYTTEALARIEARRIFVRMFPETLELDPILRLTAAFQTIQMN